MIYLFQTLCGGVGGGNGEGNVEGDSIISNCIEKSNQ